MNLETLEFENSLLSCEVREISFFIDRPNEGRGVGYVFVLALPLS